MKVKNLKKEDGMLIVEATIVFPVMFLVIFAMLFLGNAYFQKSRIDGIVAEMAYYGSAQCADPLLKETVDNGGVPSLKDADYEIQPYRYLFGEIGSESGMNAIENDVKSQVSSKISGIKTGLFSHMKPNTTSTKVEFNNMFVYSTFEVDVQYKIIVPVRLMGQSDYLSIKTGSHCEVPVSDTPEFIRNVDMIEDLVEATEAGQEAISKMNDMMEKIGEFIN